MVPITLISKIRYLAQKTLGWSYRRHAFQINDMVKMAVIGVRSQGEAVSQLTLQRNWLQALCKAFAHILSHPEGPCHLCWRHLNYFADGKEVLRSNLPVFLVSSMRFAWHGEGTQNLLVGRRNGH